jgi:hypothetical protein
MRIDDHLIIPFGCPKWDISKINIISVSTGATYLSSETPCVYINKTNQCPVILQDFTNVFPSSEKFPEIYDSFESLEYIKNYLLKNCQIQTEYEIKFLEIYFNYFRDFVKEKIAHYKRYSISPFPNCKEDIDWIFNILFPLPQAHLYVENPLDNNNYNYIPQRMVKMDFAFWTGQKIVAVEIDGASKPSASQVPRDRMLQRAGVELIHILNEEIVTFGSKIIESLLPISITKFWQSTNTANMVPVNPLYTASF